MKKRVGAEIDGVSFRADALSERPELAAKIGSVVSAWSLLETTAGGTLGFLMKADYRAAMALLGRFGTTSAKEQALRSVAKATLSEDELSKLLDLLTRFKKLSEKRNDIVHGLWGIKTTEPNVIFWLHPEEVTDLLVGVIHHAEAGDSIAVADRVTSRMIKYSGERLDSLIDEIGALALDFMVDLMNRTYAKAGVNKAFKRKKD